MPEAKKPVYCGGCRSAVFCMNCIRQWCQRQNNCPYCKRDRVAFYPCNKNPQMREVFETTIIACQYPKCDQLLSLATIELHEQIHCKLRPCSLCTQSLNAVSLQVHEAMLCQKVVVSCFFCGLKAPRDVLISSHRCYKIFKEETYCLTN